MDQTQNPLGTRAIGPLIAKFAVPAIISGLVSALYNIVDQIFIGQSVGLLGNGATNVAFPLVTICTGITLLLGIGSASNFSLALGRQDKETAVHIAANGIALMVICGCLLCAVVTLFLHPLLVAFGATEQNLPYAMLYTRVRPGHPLPDFRNRRQPHHPGGRQPSLRHGLHHVRRDPELLPGPALYLRL